MAMLQIEWLHDQHNCETCGYSYADGASVHVMRDMQWQHMFTLKPNASCFGGDHWDRDAVFKEILETFGYEIVEIG